MPASITETLCERYSARYYLINGVFMGHNFIFGTLSHSGKELLKTAQMESTISGLVSDSQILFHSRHKFGESLL